MLRVVEYIADRAEAFKIDGVLRIRFEIFAESDDEVVHGAGGDDSGVSPADFQDLFSRERPAPVGDKEF